nr:probable UDP-arabinopyranose mutase 5 [Ipomoea batatas]
MFALIQRTTLDLVAVVVFKMESDGECCKSASEMIEVDIVYRSRISFVATPLACELVYHVLCHVELWLNLGDYDAPTAKASKQRQRNTRYVDAVLTVPAKAMMPMSGINIAFNRELVGPALLPSFRLANEGKLRKEAVPLTVLKKEWEGVKLMEEVIPSSKRCEAAVGTQKDAVFTRAADAMIEWIKLWKTIKAQRT